MGKKKKYNNKKLVILVIIVIALCMIFSLLGIVKVVSKKTNNDISISEVNQLSEIINNLGSKYISSTRSSESGYTKDIYLEFKYALYENDESKEKTYTNLMRAIVAYEKSNIRLIDQSKDIIIRITYNSEENSYYYTINNVENYFEKQDSINSLNSNTEIPNTDLRANSEELKNIIDNNWNSSLVNIDGEMNKFNDYEDYFYNGIKVKNIMSKVYNVVFTKNYEEDVVNGIEVGTDLEKVQDILGKPTFQKDNIIGYKNDDFYVFFSNDEISIYRNETYETEEFTKLLSQYLNNEINLKAFMNELTYLWDDYSDYSYSSNHISIKYPHKGLTIDMDSYDDTLGIVLYQNFSMNDTAKKFIKDGNITSDDSNAVFNAEEDRINSEANQRFQAIMKKENIYDELDIKEKFTSELYAEDYIYNLNSEIKEIRFYSIDKTLPDIELKEDVYSFVWIDDQEFIYSIKNKGIYYYNLENKIKQELLLGEDEFYINNYEDGILEYDNKTIEIEEE